MDQQQQSTAQRPFGFKYFTSPTEEMIFKRRRLSEQSNSSESTGERILNESFKKMELQPNPSSLSCPSPKSEIFKCPRPIRLAPSLVKTEEPPKNFASIFDQLGIQKYLTLDCELKLNDIKAQQLINSRAAPKRPPQMFYPYGMPANFDLIIQESEDFLKQQIKEEDARMKDVLERDKFISNLNTTKVPRLSKEERTKKVQLFLEKRQNRQWKAIRYFHRKSLAEKRERVQGRFVKSQLPRFYTEEDPLSLSCGSAGERKNQKEFDKHLESLRNSQNT